MSSPIISKITILNLFRANVPSFLSKVIIKKWGLYIFLSLGLVILSLFVLQAFYFKTPFDKNYAANLVNNLLPNVLSIFVAIYIVDLLSKKREENILQAINKSRTEGVYFILGRLISKILVFLNAITQKEVTDSLEASKDIDLGTIIEKFSNYSDEELFKFMNDKMFSNENYELFLKEFKEIIEPELKVLNDTVTKIYPLVDPEVSRFFDIEVPNFMSSVSATTMMLAMPAKESFQAKAKEFGEDVEKFKKSMTYVMRYISPAAEQFVKFRRSITNIANKAKENKLFLKM